MGRPKGKMEMTKRCLAVCGLALAAWLSAGTMPAAGQQQPQQGQETPADVARLSFAQGGVQVTSGGQVQFQQAVANMPLLAGSQLQTAQDGEAEVEFGDGSVARLTPNSSLQIARLSADSVDIQQLSGLGYYELNLGEGHPSFQVEFANGAVVPTSNAIFRLDLDNAPEIAAMTGTITITSNGQQVGALNPGESFAFEPSGNSPYTVSQSYTADSWDQWNQDRDQAISEEASAQTTVRDESGEGGSSNDENWNDLDYYGNWYSVPGSGNVWVPAGIGSGWDPYGYGYWGFYPGLGGYVWISGYPWGWLPYHCGMWSYYSFGWGWAPGGCGIGWVGVIGVHGYPGYFMPVAPVWRAGHPRVLPAARLVVSDRGSLARGPWGLGHPLPVINHEATLNVGGRVIAPISRTPVAERASIGSSFTARGTSPGVRSALQASVHYQQRAYQPGEQGRSSYAQGTQPSRSFQQNEQVPSQRYNSSAPPRSTYVPRSMPTPHYSPPPSYHPPSGGSAPRGGGGGRGGR